MTAHSKFIDILRFVAACGVMLYHYLAAPGLVEGLPVPFPALAGVAKFGYFGVHLFFIISGFVIAISAQGRTAMQFLAARCLRLYPTFWVCCTLTALSLYGGDFPDLPKYLANMTMLPQVFAAAPIDGVYWSLGVEIQFYVLVFILIATDMLPRITVAMAAMLALAAGEFFFIGLQPGHPLLATEFYPLFVAGIVYSRIYRRACGWIDLAMLPFCVALPIVCAIDHQMASPDLGDKLAVAALLLAFHALILIVALRGPRPGRGRVAYALGLMSYPLYLLHNVLGRRLIDLFGATLPPGLAILAAIVLVMALAALVLVYVELPAQRAKARRAGLVTAPAEGEMQSV